MNPHLAAARALAAVLAGKAWLASSFNTTGSVSDRDKGLVQELAFGTGALAATSIGISL